MHKNFRESKNFHSIIFPDNFRCILWLLEGLVFSLLSPHSFQSEKYRLTWYGKCEKVSVLVQLFSLTQAQGGFPDFKWQGWSNGGKNFPLVSEQKNTVERDFRFWPRDKWNDAPFFARSLTLVRHSLLLNRTETRATQAKRKSTGSFQSFCGRWHVNDSSVI